MSADPNRISVTQPTQFQIVTPGGEPLLTIHATGHWDFRDDAAPTEAARVFVREVQRIVGNPTSEALAAVAADLYRNHDMPPRKDSRSYSYRNGWWDGVHHAAKVVERAASDVSTPPAQPTPGGDAS